MKERVGKASLKDDLARSFHIQMRYVMPIIVFSVAYAISAAVAIYWTTSNLFAIGQEIYVRKTIKINTKKPQLKTRSAKYGAITKT